MYPAERAKVGRAAAESAVDLLGRLETRRLLALGWVHVHYGLDHRSVRAGDEWPDKCTNYPCPAIRAALR